MNNPIDIRQLQKPVISGTGSAGKGIWDILNKDIKLFGKGLPDKIREGFYLELGTLLDAGVDIRAALELIVKEQPKKKYAIVFERMAVQIVNGSTLSNALKMNACFSAYEYYSIQIGEETGKLVVVLNELAQYYKKKIHQRRQIIGALTYPVIVLIVAFGAVSFMLGYVVPMFSDILKRSGGELPMITRVVLRLSGLVRAFAFPLLIFPFVLIIVAVSQRKRAVYRDFSARILLRVPVIGGIVQRLYLSRMANTLSLLIGSKIPILQSIQLVKKMISFYPIEQSLVDVEQDVLSGEPLHVSLRRHAIYPAKMVSLIKVGEEVNQMDIFFKKISDQYTDEVEHQTNLLSKAVEPLIIVVLGLVVGVILIAMYLPLFKLGQNF